MNKKLTKSVKTVFKKAFNTKPLMVFAPGRINLIGEHTDYNEGFVFPAAIDKGIVLALQKSDSDKCQIHALDLDEVYETKLESLRPLENGGWQNYVLGVIGEIQKRDLKISTFNAVFSGNIPSGSGMSSSAALENSFVFGLNSLFDLGLSKKEMISISQSAEHNFVGVKCGIMDQFASMFGKKRSALLLDCRTIESKAFSINFKDYRLMLVNTNVKHKLSDSAYNDRRRVCENISEMIGVKSLRDVSKSNLDEIHSKISEEEYQKALYVIEENQRVLDFAKAIETNNLKEMGQLLFQSHKGLKYKYKVSCEELDFLVDIAIESPHILGARMMGGGFGGCTINLVHKKQLKSVKKEVERAYLNQFGTNCSVYKVKLSKGTRIINC